MIGDVVTVSMLGGSHEIIKYFLDARCKGRYFCKLSESPKNIW